MYVFMGCMGCVVCMYVYACIYVYKCMYLVYVCMQVCSMHICVYMYIPPLDTCVSPLDTPKRPLMSL
jgi:hypothetical protein